MLFIGVLALLLGAQAQAQAPVTCPPAALSETQVVELLKGHVPEGRIVQIVSACHIGFFLSGEILDRLQNSGATAPVMEALRLNGHARMTLAQARQELAALEGNLQELTKSADAGRSHASEQLEANYRREREKTAQVSPKDMFEKDADYQARVAIAKAALAEVDRNHEVAKARTAAGYAADLTSRRQSLNAQIDALNQQAYPMQVARLDFKGYDANHDRLIAMVDGEEYWFTVPNDLAKELHGRWGTARAARLLAEDSSRTRYLTDSAAGGRYPGVPRTVEEEIEQMQATARAAEAERERARSVREFVAIRPGDFMMGSDSGDEKPRHRVRITKAFEMGKYEVTQAQWEAAMGTNPSHFKGADRPVEYVSWDRVQEYLKKRNALKDGYHYRLPTEAEWEYAARAGSAVDEVTNPGEAAWYDGNSGNETHPVGQKQPSAWGLYDMLGNVWEWCQDRYGANYGSGSADDPQGPASGSLRVVRGGSWASDPRLIRPSDRSWNYPDNGRDFTGFRLVREVGLP